MRPCELRRSSSASLCRPVLWARIRTLSERPSPSRPRSKKATENSRSRQLDEALARYPREAGFFNLRGVLHAQRSELEDARADFQHAVDLAPGLTPAWQNLARACQLTTDRDSSATSCAVRAWQNVLRLRPADPEARTSLATLYEWQGKFAESLREIEKLPPGESSGSALLALRCADMAGLHRTREAEELAQRVTRTAGFSEADVTAIFPCLHRARVRPWWSLWWNRWMLKRAPPPPACGS